jgi:hypothetical protein
MVAKPMRAALVRRFGEQLVIEQVPVPEIVPGRVLVKLAACGVCHRTNTLSMVTGRSNRLLDRSERQTSVDSHRGRSANPRAEQRTLREQGERPVSPATATSHLLTGSLFGGIVQSLEDTSMAVVLGLQFA